MTQSTIYALDFDGVICASATETAISAWKSAAQIWDDISTPLPSKSHIEQFCQVRPVMGTGYESIMITRLLHDDESVSSIMANYQQKTQQVIDSHGLNVDQLKQLFGQTRDQWIQENRAEWIEMNPLFPGIKEKLQNLSKQGIWYIVTTKQERFVKKILTANQVELPADRILGLDRKMSKEVILTHLIQQHPAQTLLFVEDMLSTLLRVQNNDTLKSVKLALATWGYNTEQDKILAKEHDIELIERDQFLI